MKNSASRVFVTQDDGKRNIFPALRYGDIRVFTRKELPILGDAVNEWMEELEGWIQDFQPKNDYLLLLGDPVLIAATAAIIGSMYDYFTVLKWDRQEKLYIPVKLFID